MNTYKLSNPFPTGNVVITPKQLTKEQKIYIVDRLIQGEETVQTASGRFGLSYKYIWKIKNKYVKTGFLHTKSGRPSCIDEEGFVNLVNFNTEEDPEEFQLKEAIQNEHKYS